VVLRIVRTHGGAITVETQAGRGSVFRAFLPASVEEVPRPAAETAHPQTFVAGGSVLLVEDEETVRFVTASMLGHLGFDVVEAPGGIEALAAFRQHQGEIRCVVCDLTMPRMNGWETLAALRELSPGLPVMLASGYDEGQVMAQSHRERPQAFLAKPFRVQALAEALGRALAGDKDEPRGQPGRERQ